MPKTGLDPTSTRLVRPSTPVYETGSPAVSRSSQTVENPDAYGAAGAPVDAPDIGGQPPAVYLEATLDNFGPKHGAIDRAIDKFAQAPAAGVARQLIRRLDQLRADLHHDGLADVAATTGHSDAMRSSATRIAELFVKLESALGSADLDSPAKLGGVLSDLVKAELGLQDLGASLNVPTNALGLGAEDLPALGSSRAAEFEQIGVAHLAKGLASRGTIAKEHFALALESFGRMTTVDSQDTSARRVSLERSASVHEQLGDVAAARSLRAQAAALPSTSAVSAASKRTTTLADVPTIADLEGLKSGDANLVDVQAKLRRALTSGDPKIVGKAARTMQVAESYLRKAAQDKENYEGTGFVAFEFPNLRVALSAADTTKLIDTLAKTNGDIVGIMMMTAERGLLAAKPADAVLANDRLVAMRSDKSPILAASEGHESPRGGTKSFHEEWINEVAPGLDNIREAILDTAAASGCPFAQGNHAKGVAFDDASMKLDATAPDWARDLLGDSLEGGMIRISGSQTDPTQPDQEAHMPGIRVVFPVTGQLDGSATQLIDLTANTGDTTHAKTAARHTQFTKDISVPKTGFLKGLRGSKVVRAAKHVIGAALKGESILETVGGMRNAVSVTDMAAKQRFHEHELFGRHAFFVGGRYVQLRFAVIEPKTFADPNDSDDPNARLNATHDTISKHGVKLAMYYTEIPEGRPELAEEEGWKGLPERRLAVIDVPPQQVSADSDAAQWFKDVAHVPGGKDKVFHAVGLGRHRVPIYMQSGKVRSGGESAAG